MGTSFIVGVDEVVCSVVGVSVGADVGATFSDQGGFFDGQFVGAVVGKFDWVIVGVLVCNQVGGNVRLYDGDIVGGAVRPLVKGKVGRSLAVCDGNSEGEFVGLSLGVSVVTAKGIIVGSAHGVIDGVPVFVSAGMKVVEVAGISVGDSVGISLEKFTGTCDGNTHGIWIRASLGTIDGA